MNAPVRAPRVASDRFAALLAATPAPVATGGVVRVAHCLERSVVASIPTALREHLKGLEAEEGRVTWSKIDGGAWLRSVLCVERGPIDHALTRAFELAVAEGWLPAGSWRRWCDWPAAARVALRLAAPWTKRPGVMGTDWLDGETAERVRAVAAQWSLTGLEETEGT